MAGLQRIDKVPIDATRRYYENSLVWHSWYLGPLTLAAGIIGIALLTREVLRGRRGPKGLVVTAFVPVTAVYLANPSIFPDQIWVMRRFLPFVIPGFILFAFVVVDRLLDVRAAKPRVVTRARAARGRARRRGDRVPDPHRVAGARRDDADAASSAPVEQLCTRARARRGRHRAPGRDLSCSCRRRCGATATSRSPCAVFDPDAPGPRPRPASLGLAQAWKHDGRTLFVVADSQARIDNVVPGLTPVAQISAFNGLYLREHVVKRPDELPDPGATRSRSPACRDGAARPRGRMSRYHHPRARSRRSGSEPFSLPPPPGSARVASRAQRFVDAAKTNVPEGTYAVGAGL